MGLFGAARKPQDKKEAKMVADLDAIIADPVAFRFNGQAHLIKPITTKEFYQFVEAYQGVVAVINKVGATKNEIIEAAHSIISSVCDSISLSDVEGMTQAQIAALLSLVIHVVSGKTDDEKKKTLI